MLSGNKNESTLCYMDGKWTHQPCPIQWDNDDDLTANGYVKFLGLGDQKTTGIEIETWRRDETPRFWVSISDDNATEFVLAHDVNDVCDLLVHWAPMVQTAAFAALHNNPEVGIIEKIIRRIETGTWPK